MRLIPISDFRKLIGKEAFQAISPCALTFDSEIVGYFGSKDDFLFMGDFHPRVKLQFRANEQKVRMGMPKPERVDVPELLSESK